MSSFLAFGLPQGPEWVVIFIVILLLFGAKRIPELARGLGKSMGEFKRARDEFERELRDSEKDAEKEEAKKAPEKDLGDAYVKEAPGKESRDA